MRLILALLLLASAAYADGPYNRMSRSTSSSGGGGGTGTISGTAGQVGVFDAANSITGYSGFTYNNGVPKSLNIGGMLLGVSGTNWFINSSGLISATGNNNLAIGLNTLISQTTAADNTAIGSGAAVQNVTGTHITGVGSGALSSNLQSNNTGIGYQALQFNVSGSDNVGVGDEALRGQSLYAGFRNTGVGSQTCNRLTTGSDNVCVGRRSGIFTTTGSSNVYLGTQAAGTMTTGSGNIILGAYVQPFSTTGTDQLNIGNVIYGAMGSSGTATVGGASMVGINAASPTANFQVSGTTALLRNTTIGGVTPSVLTLDVYNGISTSIVSASLGISTTRLSVGLPTSISNQAISLRQRVDGVGNGITLGTASNGTQILSLSALNSARGVIAGSSSNNPQIVLDSGAPGTVGINTLSTATPSATLHVSGTMLVEGSVTFSGLATGTPTNYVCGGAGGLLISNSAVCVVSSREVKENIKPLAYGLKEVMALRPVTYTYKPELVGAPHTIQVGLIAEEVRDVAPLLVVDGGIWHGKPLPAVDYAKTPAMLINAVQEQQQQIDRLMVAVDELRQLKGLPPLQAPWWKFW